MQKLFLLAVGAMLLLAAPAQAQVLYSYPYAYPVGPTVVYRPAYVAPAYPVMAAPVVTTYRPAYVVPPPVMTTYRPAYVSSYVTSYTPGYDTGAADTYTSYRVSEPVVTMAAPAPVMVAPAYGVARQKIYIPFQPVRNVIRAVTPGVPVPVVY